MADINRLGPERVRRSLFRSRVGDCVRRQSAGSCVFCARMLLRSRIGIKANRGLPTSHSLPAGCALRIDRAKPPIALRGPAHSRTGV